MDRVKVDQRFLNRLPEPTDMPDVPWVQWRVENIEAIVRFLEDYEVRIRHIPEHQLLIQTRFTRGDIQLSPGDCLVIVTTEGGRERLGVVRAPESIVHREADGLKTHSTVDQRNAGAGKTIQHH